MGRIPKNNAEYFSHDADASSDEKLIYLESRFGLNGYALYFKMLEALCRLDGFEIHWTEIQAGIYARKFGVSIAEMNEFIVAATNPEVGCFILDSCKIYSNGLKKRLAPLLDKREKDAERLRLKRSQEVENSSLEPEKPNVAATKPNVAATNTQSKVKESKGKESDNRERARALFLKIGEIEWNTVYTRKFPESTKTELNPIDEKALLKIADSLKKRMEKIGTHEWNEANAKNSFRKFFRLATEFDEGDGWLQKNFELNTVERKFDKIVTPKSGNSANQQGENKVLFTESSIGNSVEAFQEYIDEISWNGIDTDYYYSKFINHFVDEKNKKETEDFWKGRLRLWIEEDDISKEGVKWVGRTGKYAFAQEVHQDHDLPF
jgi:hypothetical protein